MEEHKNIPEKRYSTGVINATIWKNKGDADGEPVVFRTVSFERRYLDKDGKWKSTQTLRVNDVPRASLVLDKAFEYLALKEKEVA